MLKGNCLCGNVKFACDLNTNPVKIYQCHCSLCKKQSGSSSNSATIIPMTDFKWVNEDAITHWQKDTGFSSHFCSNCGCPVPNLLADRYYWIPVGLFEFKNTDSIKVVANFCLNTKSSWHNIDAESENFKNLPEFETLLQILL